MSTVKVDESGALRLNCLRPGDFYESEILRPDEIKLRRIGTQKEKRMSLTEAIAALESSALKFNASWDEVKRETRE